MSFIPSRYTTVSIRTSPSFSLTCLFVAETSRHHLCQSIIRKYRRHDGLVSIMSSSGLVRGHIPHSDQPLSISRRLVIFLDPSKFQWISRDSGPSKWMSRVILHIRILCFTVNSHHSYVLSVYCFTLVLSSLSSFCFFVYCVFYVWLPVLAK